MLKKILLYSVFTANAVAAFLAVSQTPPTLNLNLFGGVTITGTTGSVYAVQSTLNLAQTNSWTSLAFVQLPTTNYLFVDTSAPVGEPPFYRAMLQNSLTNMVFIPPNTFQMGSPTNELNRSSDESPQTTV